MGVYDGVYKLDTTQAADQNWSALHKEMGKKDRTAVSLQSVLSVSRMVVVWFLLFRGIGTAEE